MSFFPFADFAYVPEKVVENGEVGWDPNHPTAKYAGQKGWVLEHGRWTRIISGSSRPPNVPPEIWKGQSAGMKKKAIAEWQQWLASMGIASIAPNSFALKNRMTYSSPIDKETYEKLHAFRSTEIEITLKALQQMPWADGNKIVLAGTSEGAVPVARYTGKEFAGRIMFAWSCEDNYFVTAHKTAIPDDQPTLNFISSTDPYFSPSNTWVGNAQAIGHCGAALKSNKKASVVLIPGAPHTVLTFSQAKGPVQSFLTDLFKL